MSEAVLILKNMRGGCATVGDKVHTLFRFDGHRVASRRDDAKAAGAEMQHASVSATSATSEPERVG